jgi:glycerol-3-phosphate O-acyltransferase
MIRLRIEDHELQQHATEWSKRPAWLEEETGILAYDVEARLKDLTPVGKTGLTRSSIETRHPELQRWEVGSWTRGNILRYLNYGVQPHVILPKTRRALRWISQTTGEIVFAARVFHPGIKPLRIMDNAVHPAWAAYLVRLEKRMKEG